MRTASLFALWTLLMSLLLGTIGWIAEQFLRDNPLPFWATWLAGMLATVAGLMIFGAILLQRRWSK